MTSDVTARVRVHAGDGRLRVDLQAGTVIPRLVSADERECVVAFIAGGALLLAGDEVRISVEVGAGCRLRLEDVGGTVAYGGDAPSGWHVDIRVHAGGLISWAALPFVVCGGADVHRTTTLDLGPDAVALLRETLVLGRHGETGGRIRTATDVLLAGRPVLREALDLDGAAPRPGLLGRHRVLDTALLLGRRATGPDAAMQLESPGTLVRALGDATHLATVEAAWSTWAAELAETTETVDRSLSSLSAP